jgi:hypothetical protein
LHAFDLHRVGDITLTEGPDRRRCEYADKVLDVRGKPKLQRWTTAGICELGSIPYEAGVTIWQTIQGNDESVPWHKAREPYEPSPRSEPQEGDLFTFQVEPDSAQDSRP